MFFNSVEFLVFLPVVLCVYYVLSRRAQNAWLVLASYFFYGWWDWRFCGLLAWPWPLRGAAYAVMFLLIVLLRPLNDVPFIYFQF